MRSVLKVVRLLTPFCVSGISRLGHSFLFQVTPITSHAYFARLCTPKHEQQQQRLDVDDRAELFPI